MNQKEKNKLRSQIQLAIQHLRNGEGAEAGSIYDEVSVQAGDDTTLNVELGQLCSLFGANDKAVRHFGIAVEQSPEDANYLGFLGVASLRNGDIEEAFSLLSNANSIDSGIPQVLWGLGMVYMERTEFDEARNYLAKALEVSPKDTNILVNLAKCLTNLNDYEQALKLAEKAANIDSTAQNAQSLIGQILTDTGQTDKAIRHFEKMIRSRSNVGASYTYLARLKKFSSGDRPIIMKAEKTLSSGMAPKDRLATHFALGKMYDDCEEYEKAFAHFQQANLLQKSPYHISNDRRWFKRLSKLYTKKSIAHFENGGHDSALPVFIIGMPRSGTTLMERIIASHSQATGAGELLSLPQIAHQIVDEKERGAVAAARKNLTVGKMAQYADEYLRVLQRGHKNNTRIVDKLPGNYQNVGLIAALFPNATIIHAIRHPLDTCLSCYFQAFEQVRWTCDLEDIAAMYRLYREYMDHWSKLLPQGRILDVHYEQLVEDPASEGRRMIEACGLTWDPECLEFHRQEAVVRTVSHWQVRQPIYRSSMMRWRNYADHLGELANSLADYLANDSDQLAEHGIKLAQSRRFGWFG